MPSQSAQPGAPLRLERNAKGELVAHVPGREPVVNVAVARCFPWSLADEYISIRNADGKEIALLETLAGLDDQTRALIEQELAQKVFVPRIRRVIEFKAEFDVVAITADTDRGQTIFQIHSRDDVRILGPGRALFRDVDGNLYEVENVLALDRASRAHLEQYF